MKDRHTEGSATLTPIRDFIREYAPSGISRFHMPGHKGTGGRENDITEIAGADSLYTADGIIRRSERIASRLFGTADTLFCTEGSSQCIRAMLALAARFSPAAKPVILAARNVHRSFLTACALLDLEVKWLFPEEDGHFCTCPVNGRRVYETLSRMKEKPAAVYLTSPDYLGNIQDVRGIAEAAHAFSVPLLVDNAHGSYLHFLKQPLHPMDLGADLCCDSAHKTLPALTGCAYLQIGKEAPSHFLTYARTAMALFGSTSPSYLLLSSLDGLNRVLSDEFRDDLSRCVAKVQSLKRRWPQMMYRPPEAMPQDPLRITLDAFAAGCSGMRMAEKIRSFRIECEYADLDYVVLMPSPYNTEEDFDRLEQALSALSEDLPGEALHADPPVSLPHLLRPRQRLSIRNAMLSPSRMIPVEEAVGQICADAVLSCPPAVPVLVCGEEVPAEAIPVLRRYGVTHLAVVLKDQEEIH